MAAGFTRRGAVSLIRSTVNGNSTSGNYGDGGGISTLGAVSLIDSTVSGNSTSRSAEGGGISARGAVSIVSSTVSGNTSGGEGGGIFVASSAPSITISNSIVAGNSDDGTAPDLQGDSSLAINSSLIGATDLTINGNGNQVGTLSNPLDPLLGPLADNGGLTQTHALLLGSPAIDAGSDALAAGLPTDQRGVPFVRSFNDPTAPGAGVDIGSFELQTLNTIVVDNRVDENDGDLSAGNLSLREAISLVNGDFEADTITFDPAVFTGGSNSLIRLTQGELTILKSVTIDATAANDLTITGDAADDDITDAANITNLAASTSAQLIDNSRVFRFEDRRGESDLTLNNLTITGGRERVELESGGGVLFLGGGDLTLTNSVVSGNSTSVLRPFDDFSRGGGIFSTGDVFLTNSTVSNNSAFNSGGGIDAFGDVFLNNSTVSGNETLNRFDGVGGGGGGGIRASGDVFLTNSTVSGNETFQRYDGGGGGIRVYGAVSLINSTVTGNRSANEGGGIFVNDGVPSFTLSNSIVAGNAAVLAPDLRFGYNSLSINYSLIGATDLAIPGTGNQIGTLTNPLDPLLGPLADNGGLTLTHALLEGSSAIDAGNNPLAVDENGNPLSTDQRADARIQSGTVDIGAVESEAENPFLLGDVNRDGAVNFLDISPFVSLLSDDIFQDEADINRDGEVSFLDISPFVALLTSGGSADSVTSITKSAEPAIAQGSAVRSKANVVEPPVSSVKSPVSPSKPESIAPEAETAASPSRTEASDARKGDAETAAVKQNPDAAPPSTRAPLVLVGDSSSSSKAATNEPTAVGAIEASVTQIEFYVGPFSLVKNNFLGALSPSLEGFRSDEGSIKRSSLTSNVERLELLLETGDEHPPTIESTDKSFSTAAELFDAQFESLDDVFDFELEETLAGQI